MKGYDIYQKALSFVSEKPQVDDLQSYCVGWINTLLSEAFPYENGLRRYKGIEELTERPMISSLQDELPYQYEICDPALVYGLTSFVAQDDDNEYRTERYRQMYISALYDTQRYEMQTIEDYYAQDTGERGGGLW